MSEQLESVDDDELYDDELGADWEPVSTIPHDAGWVLVYGTMGLQIDPQPGIYVAAILPTGRGFWSPEGSWVSHVTHWRRLPDPPC